MLLTVEIGQKVVERVAEYVSADINIMNLTGEIIASTDNARLHQMHGGAKRVLNDGNSLTITEYNLHQFPGTKEGVNLPILHHNKITGVVGVSGTPASILPITGLVRATVELLLDQIHFQRELYNEEKQWNYWFQQITSKEDYDRDALEEIAAYSLKVDLHAEWSVITLLNKGDAGMDIDTVLFQLNHMHFSNLAVLHFKEKEIIIITNEKEFMIRQAVTLLSNLYKGTRISVGGAYFGMDGIRTSYLEAKHVLSFSSSANQQILYSEDWYIKRLITTISRAEYTNICSKYKVNLDKLGEEYKETVRQYLAADFSLKKTADQLHIHRNTLLYRLEQVKLKTGLDPKLFRDAFILKIIQEYN